MLKKIKKLHFPIRDDIGDLRTVRPLPNPDLPHLDPFLFLNHHGHQVYPPHNNGLPFGPHPHRGFETVTFILQGDISHRDSQGHESIITAGGIQWMTAGKGIIHEEVSSQDFKKHGGELEILQLWINLPSSQKMTKPHYVGLQASELPRVDFELYQFTIIAGEWQGNRGALTPLYPLTLLTLELKKSALVSLPVKEKESVFFYLVKGEVNVNGVIVSAPHLVEFEEDHEEIQIEAKESSFLLFGHAMPFREPIVSYGPFVMNTREEILEAIRDYEEGRLR